MSVFTTYAMARPTRVRAPRTPRSTKPKPPNPNPNHKQLRLNRTAAKELTSIGVEATTFTRLPPKDDFSLPSSLLDFSSAEEVKLSEATLAVEKKKKVKNVEKKNEIEDLSIEEDDDVSYGECEVFGGSYDSELEDEDEEFEEIEGVEYEYEYEEIERRSDVDDGEELEEEEEEVKEKGVPAVMRCFDRAKIYVKAGDGGNGVVAMRREKFVPLGGPSGGDGGRGGNVYIEVDGSMNSLLPFRNSVHFRAGRGDHGRGQSQNGAKGEDVVVKVAPGTVIREAGKEEVLLELLHPGQRGLLLPGGRGGRGNASFKSGANKVPRIAENGAEGPEM